MDTQIVLPKTRTRCATHSLSTRSRSQQARPACLNNQLWWSSCTLNAPKAIAAPRPLGESEKGSAPQSVTVEEVQRILVENKGEPDEEVARQLYGLELTEKMSSARLKSLKQNVTGKKGQWALVALADASVFLSPAAEDVLPQAHPELNEQRRMIASTVDYLGKTLPKLPNFYATRTTVRLTTDRSRSVRE